ncbi:TPA: hypothetical protein NNT57_004625 [Salmonella enterica]|uniref:Putative major tail tube protein n=2 Tax=Lokivirus IMEAB3 TaxID=2560266 RepID=A0A481S2Y8_9CAUD|nr:putative major tail tube protein [Acinetobacter phage IMEAB3]AHI60031.1 putative major tail tube protein [Acinetobacter phage IMEAB3]QBG78745.1 putative major tail tube protein [Acinetobacter phage vB_AbaS_D0]HCH8772143.1 hypothetical protein [Salmonella enterica]HCH9143081.1 hypothetical protein [Salmonella enterica]
MVCQINKIDSNITSLFIAEEECPKQLPASPIWYGQEPNSYSDFGADISTVARSPIDPSRQRLKGTISGLDAVAGFNTDLTETNLTRLMQGFCFANAHQDASTQPLNGSSIALTGVDGTEIKYTAAAGLGIFGASDLIKASGFGVPSNNGLKKVSDANATGVIVWGSLVTEATVSVAAKLERVGHEFAEGDVVATISGGKLVLTATAGSFTGFGLLAGQWLFLGGDDPATQLGTNVGFARIEWFDAKTIAFDLTTFTAVAHAGAAISLRAFWGTVIRNEPLTENIKTRSYQLQRQLGKDDAGIQSEYVVGAVPNELTINIPTEDKVNVDLGFIGLDNEQRNGTVGVKAGSYVPAKGEQAYNTSSDVIRNRMYVIDPTNTQPTGLFGYISEGTLEINNNVTAIKAVGSVGGFDVSVGTFEVGGSVTAFFTNIAAVQAIRNNADVGFYSITAARNTGFLFDIPLMAMSGGQLQIEADNPINIPIDNNAAKSKFGYTLLTEFFAYLPTVGMPQ